ncbi:MAG: hypothetical protein MJ237_08000 [bacterium]|nr:hypothetical protein [bacterium]
MLINNININTNTGFNGYDAKLTKGFYLTDSIHTKSLQHILDGLNAKTRKPMFDRHSTPKEYLNLLASNEIMWAQDYITFLQNKILYDGTRTYFQKSLSKIVKQIVKSNNYNSEKITSTYIRGGNFYICQKDNKKIMLLNKKKFNKNEVSVLKQTYNVDEVIPVPTLDYHLDLSIRPLTNGNVLVADYNKTLEILDEGLKKVNQVLCKKDISDEIRMKLENVRKMINITKKCYELTIEKDPYKPKENLPKLIESLKSAGMNPIPVPAAYHLLKERVSIDDYNFYLNDWDKGIQTTIEQHMQHNTLSEAKIKTLTDLVRSVGKAYAILGNKKFVSNYRNNFINALAYENNGEIQYITNNSMFDIDLGITPEVEELIGFSTKNAFIESVAPYIKKDNIHFINNNDTDTYFSYDGGVHCIASEII